MIDRSEYTAGLLRNEWLGRAQASPTRFSKITFSTSANTLEDRLSLHQFFAFSSPLAQINHHH
jgi:hypothetical protein